PPSEPGAANTGIKLVPDESVLKYHEGDEIRLTEAEFVLLSDAYFAQIEEKYT
ncbi:MAG: hypothetical protein QOG64_3185, partial [Acidimicrobiaceae bacterium]|nr:hypothetical protein [Acidimicrobiaceae bacterium]